VTDVWEAKEQFESFAQEQLGPLPAKVGIAPPEMTYYEVHNYLTADQSATV
jgi:hypothetical protein